ncbi:MAG: tetratricopeptide repeat protein, partial [Phormidesmis sp.]
ELGDRHPDTATGLNNLAALYESQGRYGEAEPLYVQALEIRKAELGDRHPDTASSLFNLAALYYQTQRYQQALTHIQQALDIYIPALGADHPTTQAAMSWRETIKNHSSPTE